ncbi:hypothetical protein C8Q70DRAFT_321099 [Cubamyces menziesii]|nr:hypothetical protein C8Q70DRAFT_321099 [Cubamyces menziesii]
MTDCLLLILITFHHDLFSSRTLAASYLATPCPTSSDVPSSLTDPQLQSYIPDSHPHLISTSGLSSAPDMLACGRFPLEAVVLTPICSLRDTCYYC